MFLDHSLTDHYDIIKLKLNTVQKEDDLCKVLVISISAYKNVYMMLNHARKPRYLSGLSL